MPIIKIQSDLNRIQRVYYEYNSSDAPLGEGGMGKVYKGRCRHEITGQEREVAIKCLHSDLPPHVIARAKREASVKLRNDNLIEMIEFIKISGQTEIGEPVVRYYVVSEYLHGVTLEQLLSGKITDYRGDIIPFLQRLYEQWQRDPYHFALKIMRNLLSGLSSLHDNGYIHRDIDPSNIMITSNGKIKLIDFGIAKDLRNRTREFSVHGQFIGRPKYAAPELVKGLVGDQNLPTDLYAVGILLYYLVVGTVPFDGEMAEVLEQQLTKKVPLKNIKQNLLKSVIKKATQKKKADRYQSCAEFRLEIDKLMLRPYPDDSKPIFKSLAIGVSAAAVVFVLIVAMNYYFREQEQQEQKIIVDENHSNDSLPLNPIVTYEEALALLKDNATAKKGFEEMQKLANSKDHPDSDALLLLSGLYFQSEEKEDKNNVDSLKDIRDWLKIAIDNNKAHALLIEAVKLNPSNYKAQYELGCNYKSGEKRGTKRDEKTAYIHFKAALDSAVSVGDKEFSEIIREKMSNVKPKKYNIK